MLQSNNSFIAIHEFSSTVIVYYDDKHFVENKFNLKPVCLSVLIYACVSFFIVIFIGGDFMFERSKYVRPDGLEIYNGVIMLKLSPHSAYMTLKNDS